MEKLGAVILAAGLSSRMNRFKPLLPVDGQSMIERVVSMMKSAGAEPVVVVTGHRAEDIRAHLKDAGVVFVHNERYSETQMLDSLLLGLQVLEGKCGRVLISPSDVPLVQQATVERVLSEKGAFVRPLHLGEPGHPVALDMSLFPMLRQYRGEGGLRRAIESSGIDFAEFETDDRGVVMDNDTEEDYRALLDYYEAKTKKT